MNSRRARNGAFFAQLGITVKTPGTNFSVVGTKGTADNVAGGRRFRAPGFEDLKIRGLLRIPPSASWVVKKASLGVFFPSFRPGRSQG
jgi:hypothetical protein